MKTLIPYLHFNGNCEDALKFYAEAFNGKASQISRFGEGPMEVPAAKKNQIMHARFEAESIRFMASDGMDKPNMTAGTAVQLSIDFTDRDEMERVWAKLEKGGTVKMPLGDQFWGARFGMLEDKYGIHWMLNSEAKK
jgi:PhnB protein